MKYGNLTLEDTEKLMDKLGGINAVMAVLMDKAVLTYKQHVIYLGTPILHPLGYKISRHNGGDPLVWEPKNLHLYQNPAQQGEAVSVRVLYEDLPDDTTLLNANVFDYLIKNPELIPEEWQQDEDGSDRTILFPGTVYYDGDKNYFVRAMKFNAGKWTDCGKSFNLQYNVMSCGKHTYTPVLDTYAVQLVS